MASGERGGHYSQLGVRYRVAIGINGSAVYNSFLRCVNASSQSRYVYCDAYSFFYLLRDVCYVSQYNRGLQDVDRTSDQASARRRHNSSRVWVRAYVFLELVG